MSKGCDLELPVGGVTLVWFVPSKPHEIVLNVGTEQAALQCSCGGVLDQQRFLPLRYPCD
jgi:hypothetical protein